MIHKLHPITVTGTLVAEVKLSTLQRIEIASEVVRLVYDLPTDAYIKGGKLGSDQYQGGHNNDLRFESYRTATAADLVGLDVLKRLAKAIAP